MEEGRLLDETIDWFFSRQSIPETLKPLLYEIVAGVVRWKDYLDWVLSHYIRKPLKKDLRYLLWVALYQALFMKKGTHHVVNETVEYVKKEKGVAVANFVNAVLRKAVREGRHLPLPEVPEQRLSVAYSFPEWLVRRWLARLGEQETEALLSMLNTTPEFTLRVDREENDTTSLHARKLGRKDSHPTMGSFCALPSLLTGLDLCSMTSFLSHTQFMFRMRPRSWSVKPWPLNRANSCSTPAQALAQRRSR